MIEKKHDSSKFHLFSKQNSLINWLEVYERKYERKIELLMQVYQWECIIEVDSMLTEAYKQNFSKICRKSCSNFWKWSSAQLYITYSSNFSLFGIPSSMDSRLKIWTKKKSRHQSTCRHLYIHVLVAIIWMSFRFWGKYLQGIISFERLHVKQ